ncbi:MAG: HAMP domain-containing protein [Deltaproteobacteria bacterium]|nr:HAMP domain-containing protein [Deltaproteobacteria bacterium]
MQLKINSLQQRLIIFLVLPVIFFLSVMGALGYLYIRASLFKEWQEAAILRLERAAHSMDMRLSEPIQWMENFAKPGRGQQGEDNHKWILKHLRQLPGVSQVDLTWESGPENGRTQEGGSWPVAAAKIARVSPPEYFYPPGQGLVGLKSQLLDDAGRPLGQLTVLVKFDYLMADVLASGWLQSNMACLVNNQGDYLAHSDPAMVSRHCLGENQNPLELAMLTEMKEKPYGTVMGQGQVIGFYRLHDAPWALMLHAEGRQILAPIRRFHFYYLGGGFLCLTVILVLIRLGTNPMVRAVRRISAKASQVAAGEYGEPLPVTTRDEIGQLTGSFNDMVAGLKERDLIRNTFGRYVDEGIARELLRRPEAARRLGGEKREVVILFSDLRGFTPLAETLSPEATIRLVNRHFSGMIEVIRAHHGIIVDFLGDAVLAFFDPLERTLAATARQAVDCALRMQAAQAEANTAQPQYPTLEMGIGLHAGEVVVGNIGSESRAKYGIVGSAVNLTHRIQGQAKGGEVVVSEAVWRHTGQFLTRQREFQTRLKGIQEPVTLYVVAALSVTP